MKKFFRLLFIGLLTLTSCSDGRDEPVPEENTTLLMAVNAIPGFQEEAIYDLQGNKIYECDKGDRIHSLVAEGRNWYALLQRPDSVYYVVKNGKYVRDCAGIVFGFALNKGSLYTMINLYDHIWCYKDFFTTCFDLDIDGGVLYNTFSVHDGNIAMGINGENPSYWYNGLYIPVKGLDEGFRRIYGIDIDINTYDELITFESYQSGKNMYWWKWKKNELPSGFVPTMSRIVNGHAFILGEQTDRQGVGSLVHGVPAVLIDGIETILSDEGIDCKAVSVVSQGMNSFILTQHTGGPYSCVYKNMMPLRLPDIHTPYHMGPYGSSDGQDGKSNISMLGIKAIAVLEKK